MDREKNEKLRRDGMDHSVEGTVDDLKGRLKDAAGGLTGDGSMQAEGKIDRLKGKAKRVVGEMEQDAADRNENPTR